MLPLQCLKSSKIFRLLTLSGECSVQFALKEILFELGFIQGSVDASFPGQKFFMGTAFDQFSVVDDDNFVGIADGGKAVGDDENRTVFHQVVNGSLNNRF